ncbi:MAG: DNA methyltransferase [Dehalococcoidia bacterium]|nr:DNA methyltransferase [Dehalococcoidia bacterium]
MAVNIETNVLYYGDNLIWLRNHDCFPNESVDLVYLDPPFNSNADYNVIFNEPSGEESQAQIKAFDDTWRWEKTASEEALRDLGRAGGNPQIVEYIQWLAKRGDKQSTSMAAYLSMMAVRLIELNRVLKSSGSLYLHCDPTASHYLKVVLDTIFGAKNFRNELIWHYRKWSTGKLQFQRNHDVILFYSRTQSTERVFNQLYMERAESTKKRFGESKILSGRDENGRRLPSQIEDEDSVGARQDDVWEISRVPPIKQLFPTEKPAALLDRIIAASTGKNSVVLDPFCGCGTTIIAAQKARLKWIGIDVTWLAIDLVEKRLKESYGKKAQSMYLVKGQPVDVSSARALANKSKKEFEIWAISLVGAASREHDGGVDGLLSIAEGKGKSTKVIVQVKGGKSINPGMVRDLMGTIEKEKAAIGLLITLEEPTAGMRELATHTGSYESPIWHRSYPRIQIKTIKDLLEGRGFDLPYGESPLKKASPINEEGINGKLL